MVEEPEKPEAAEEPAAEEPEKPEAAEEPAAEEPEKPAAAAPEELLPQKKVCKVGNIDPGTRSFKLRRCRRAAAHGGCLLPVAGALRPM